MLNNKQKMMTLPEIEGLLFNADLGDRFTGLRHANASAFQAVAFANGMGVEIQIDEFRKGTYVAVLVTQSVSPRRAAAAPAVTPGFAILLGEDTNLGLAVLIAEDEEGHAQPVAVCASISEAREIAQADLRGREKRLLRDEDPGLCPWEYKLWADGVDGYAVAFSVEAGAL